MGVLTLNNRVAEIRQKMAENNIDALLVTHRPNVFYLSGFSGTSGFLLLTSGRPYFIPIFVIYSRRGRKRPPSRLQVNSIADHGCSATYFP